ncbi:hypothetical protein [Halosolutus gelatinilyticus]|uniref:hypothetical protein n=1 Tax=Halosolutus gelatinilyticus TaxID=2931975 RepID=UPI001FF59161|nr:hypothetical protein [Halosolutus gelatinilyticus]
MDIRTSTGLLATLTAVLLGIVGVWGFVDGYLLGSPGAWFAPTIGSLVVAAIAVGTLVLLGARSKRWRENPYW